MNEKDKLLRTLRHFMYLIIILVIISAVVIWILMFSSWADEMRYYIETNEILVEKLKQCYTE